MRISTFQLYQRGLDGILDVHADVGKTQEQIARGTRVLTPADDPVAAVQMMRLDREMAILTQYKDNTSIAENKLSIEETTLQGVEDVVMRLRDISLLASNPALSADNRGAMAIEVRERLSQVKALMNSKDSSGEYIFGGFQGGLEPFVDRPGGGYLFQGDEGQRKIDISNNNSIAVSDSGKELFVDLKSQSNTFSTSGSSSNAVPLASITAGRVMDQAVFDNVFGEDYVIEFNAETDIVPNGPNFSIVRKLDGQPVTNPAMALVPYAAGTPIRFNGIEATINGSPQTGDQFQIESSSNQSLLTTIERLAVSLETDNPTTTGVDGALEITLGDTLNNLDTVQNKVLEVRAKIGARLNINEATFDQHEVSEIEATRLLSEVKDLDFAEAISRLEFQSFVLEAAQRSFSRISSLSLFNFL